MHWRRRLPAKNAEICRMKLNTAETDKQASGLCFRSVEKHGKAGFCVQIPGMLGGIDIGRKRPYCFAFTAFQRVINRLPQKKGAQEDMAENEEKKKTEGFDVLRVGNPPKDAGPYFKEKCGSPAGQGRKGADADAHKESCDNARVQTRA